MYIGSTGERGLHHLVYEVVDNAIDEALAGYCDTIEVRLLADGGCRVVHAGGKFGGSGYSVSGGLHGVGVSVVNALSSRLHVQVHRDGSIWEQDYHLGVPQAALAKTSKTDVTGTTVTFWPSEDIFDTVHFDFETLRSRFQQMAFLNKGVIITLIDERVAEEDVADADADGSDAQAARTGPKQVTFCYEGGLIDYVAHLNASKKSDPVNPDIIAFEAEDGERSLSLEVAMQWTTAFSESVHTYANTINTHEGGTHEEGFRAALTRLVNEYARAQKLLKDKDDNLTGDDIREGLTAVISVKLAEPQFEGQTKTKLGNTEAKTFVQNVVRDQLA
ncbi:MAG: DNA topoisomerase IV subunit B, partial [Micrococcales bacterium]